ncbi:UNKNOWN [Stylonychia lemnae]|uniref:Transmembrane protein n=1 Tax=Stylonychia lemnae TaxID=5949 RepID=A0A078A7V0_STYLE|nr:UNKNOWN [Stylonychia lemnae]|eukprot:CDW77647.1 UNKNOWN [Stylonychia lemnae]
MDTPTLVLKIDGMIVLNSNPSNSLDLYSINFYADKLKITHSKGKVQQIETGGAISCQSCGEFHLNNSQIKNSNAQQGGGIFLSQNDLEKIDGQNYIIQNTQFENTWSSMYDGGAISILNIKKLTIIDSSFNNCSIILSGFNRFTNNKASISGGAIYWNENEPNFDMKKTYFYNNIAGIYGNNIRFRNWIQKLGKITEQRFLQTKETSILNLVSEVVTSSQNSSNASGFRSGDQLSTMYLALIDKYGQIVTTNSNSKITVSVCAISKNNLISTKYQPIIEGQIIFYSETEVFTVTGLQFTGQPGLSYQIVFYTDGIDNSKPANRQYLQQSNNEEKQSFNLNVELRECQIGEKFSDKGSCELCPEGSTFSLVNMTSPGSCLVCPTSIALCYGESFIGPKPGYWRMNNKTSTFIECLNPQACLGIIPPYYISTGSCDLGYQGVGICAVIIVVLMIKSTLDGALVKRNVMSIFQKILMNHLQLITMTASFNFNWPAKVVEFFSSSQTVAQAQTQVLSIDCFINKGLGQSQKFGEEQIQQSLESGITSSLLYLKLLMFAVLPFLLAILSYAFWMIVSCKKQSKNILMTKAVSSLVILLFLIHPTLVSYFFKAFDCIKVDGESRNKEDLQINCSTKQHQYFSLLIALPGLIVQGIGIPFFAFVLMFRKSKNLDTLETRAQYGFLFRGYKKQFYNWEIYSMVSLPRYDQNFRSIQYLLGFNHIHYSNMFSDDNFEKDAILNCDIKQFRDYIINNLYNDSVLWIILYPRHHHLYCLGEWHIIFIQHIRNNIIFFAYWSFQLIKELYSLIILKFGKLYLILFLCNNNQRFEKVKKQMAINEENGILRENLMSYLANIKQMYSSGQIILNKNVIEKLQLYLSQEKIAEMLGKKNIVNTIEDENDDKQMNAYREIRKLNTRELRQSIPTMDICRSIEDFYEEDCFKDNDQGEKSQRFENIPDIREFEDENNYFEFNNQQNQRKQQIIKDSMDEYQFYYKTDDNYYKKYFFNESFNKQQNFKDDQDIVKRLRGFSFEKQNKKMRIKIPGYYPTFFQDQYYWQDDRKDVIDQIQSVNQIKSFGDQTFKEKEDQSNLDDGGNYNDIRIHEDLDFNKNRLIKEELFQVVQKKNLFKKLSKLRKTTKLQSKILQQSASSRNQTQKNILEVKNTNNRLRGTLKIIQQRQSNDLVIDLKNEGINMLTPANLSIINQSSNYTPIHNDGFTNLDILKDGEDEQLFIDELEKDLDVIKRIQIPNKNSQ